MTKAEFSNVYDAENHKFRKYNYVNFFTKKLNDLGVSCVLVASRKYSEYSLVLNCKHEKCTRSYKLISYLRDLTYTILIDGDCIHESKVYTTRPLNGDQRDIAMEKLRHMGTREFAKEMKDKADRNLTALGNLDTIKSKPVYSNMKSTVLGESDFDKDHIKDLSKMREKQLHDVRHNIPGAEVYIQHVSSNDFYVHAFSSTQIRILQQMLSREEEITLHVDATGTIVSAPEGVEKRIYYYVASIALPLEDGGPKMLFPVSEMISSAHDAFTIETWLRKFKDEFSRQVGSWTPPAHFVTDFSFAILNAVSSGLNNEDLIDYVNRIYDEIVNKECGSKKKSSINICCNHFMKTTAQDVNSHFPKNQTSNVVRTFLKETLALMFNISYLDALTKIYQNLSEILLSKYVTAGVSEALNFITNLADHEKKLSTDELPQDVIEEDNIEILQFDEIENDAMYRKPRFFQMFNKVTAQPNYNEKDKKLNNFYCPQYCDLLLNKYISILPLWTSLTSKTRKSNANAESLFNIIKTRLRENAVIIGHIPLRSSRFLRFTRKMINNIAEEFWEQLPRYRCCNKKRRSTSQSPQVGSKRQRSASQSPYVGSERHANNSEFLPIVTPKSSRVFPQSSLSQETTPKSTRPRRQFLSQSVKTAESPIMMTPKSSVFPQSSLSQETTPKSSRPRRVSELSSQTVKTALSPIMPTPKSSRLRQESNACYSEELIKSTTPKSLPPSCYIGDRNATESWGPKRRTSNPKHTYFNSNLLKKNLIHPKFVINYSEWKINE